MSLKDLKKKYEKKKISKVSPEYLTHLCKRYYLGVPRDLKKPTHATNGAYKGILQKIEYSYPLFENFIKNYILINRALALMGRQTTCHQVFNIFFVKDHLNLFTSAIYIIDKSDNTLDYIELKFKLEEEAELGEA